VNEANTSCLKHRAVNDSISLPKDYFFNSLIGIMLMNILDGRTTANDSDESEINFFAIYFFRTMNNRYLD